MSKTFIRVSALILCLALCLVLFPACAGKPSEVSGFSSVTVDKKGKNITAVVALDEETLSAHKGEKAFLYELLPGETAEEAIGRGELGVKSVKAEMKFTFPLVDGTHTRLYSSFVLRFADGTLLPSDASGHYIDNPEVLSGESDDALEFPRTENPKGLNIDHVDHAAEMNVAHAMLSVPVSAFSAGDGSFVFDGKTYSYDKLEIAYLDRMIADATDAGMQVSLTLDPDAPLSTSDFAAALDFLADRYDGSELGRLTALFVGTTSDMAAEQIATLARLSYQALRARFALGRIYINAPESTTLDSCKTFFNNVGAAIAQSGAFEWGAAVSPSLNKTASSAEVFKAKSLPSFSEFLRTSASGVRASYFAVTGLSYDAADEELQAAMMAYAYRISRAANADMIFAASHEGDTAGLCAADGTPRLAAAFYSDIDRGLDAEDAALCSRLAGSAWSLLSEDNNTRRVGFGTASVGVTGFAEKALFDFTTGETYDFSGVGNVTDPETRNSAAYNAPVLYTWLAPTRGNSAGVRRVMEDGEALEGASSLSVRLLAQIPSADKFTATLRLDGTASDGSALTYFSDIVLENGTWQTVTFQIGAFVADADLSKPCILTLTSTPDSEVEDEYVLWVRGIDVRTPSSLSSALTSALLIGAGVLVGFVGVLVLYRTTVGKKKRKK